VPFCRVSKPTKRQLAYLVGHVFAPYMKSARRSVRRFLSCPRCGCDQSLSCRHLILLFEIAIAIVRMALRPKIVDKIQEKHDTATASIAYFLCYSSTIRSEKHPRCLQDLAGTVLPGCGETRLGSAQGWRLTPAIPFLDSTCLSQLYYLLFLTNVVATA